MPKPRASLIYPSLLLLIAYLHIAFMTAGSFTLIAQDEMAWTFDSLGQAMLKGSAAVRWDSILSEGVRLGDRTVAYFGCFPALLRIAFNAVFPQYFGGWSRVSCLCADFLSLAALYKILESSLSLNVTLTPSQRRILLYSSLLGFALGTPYFFLMSTSIIYHEAMSWALCGSLMALVGIVRCLLRDKIDSLSMLWISAGFSICLLSRITFALPIALAAPLLLFRSTRASAKSLTTKRSILALALVVLSVCLQAWYNYARFETRSSFSQWNVQETIATSSAFVRYNPYDMRAFNIQRIPTALSNYFGTFAGHFISSAPFVRMEKISYGEDFRLYRPGPYREFCLSLPVAEGWLLLAGGYGLFLLLSSSLRLERKLVALAFSLQVLPILCFVQITQRYTIEFLPVLIVGLAYLLKVYDFEFVSTFRQRSRLCSMAFLMAFAACCNALGTLSYLATYSSSIRPKEQAQLISILSTVDEIRCSLLECT